MGEVYKARDARLNRIVAIKVSQAQFSERFENEARAVAALNHPHICTLFDVGPNYLVMEFVEGAPLKGPLPTKRRSNTRARFGWSRCSASERHHPPRPEARQHPGCERYQAARLRTGEADHRPQGKRSDLDTSAHWPGPDSRDLAVHVSGAAAGQAGGLSQ